jgi:hypothetical protein
MFKKLLLVLFIVCAVNVQSQNKGTGPQEPSAREEIRIRKQRKHEARERRKQEKAERKKVKEHHKRLQTKTVQKRMKKSKKTAIRNNEHKREFFMTRWFRKKNKATSPKKKD